MFSEDEIKVVRKNIILKRGARQGVPFITCIIRNKDIQLKPEEIVPQLLKKMMYKRTLTTLMRRKKLKTDLYLIEII